MNGMAGLMPGMMGPGFVVPTGLLGPTLLQQQVFPGMLQGFPAGSVTAMLPGMQLPTNLPTLYQQLQLFGSIPGATSFLVTGALPSMPGQQVVVQGLPAMEAPQAATMLIPADAGTAPAGMLTAPTTGPVQPEAPIEEQKADETAPEEPEEEVPPLVPFPALQPPGPLGDSASAVAARHVIEKAGCDTWFLRHSSGDWEEVVRFWPPPDDADVAKPPKLKKPEADNWGVYDIALRCQRHEEIVRALLVSQYGTSRAFTASKFPCPRPSEWCFWTIDGRQLVVNAELTPEEKTAAAKNGRPFLKRCPPDGQRWRLLRNSLRSQLCVLFKATKLRRLERAIRRKDRITVQAYLDQMTTSVPDSLAKAAKTLLASASLTKPLPSDNILGQPPAESPGKAETSPPVQGQPPALPGLTSPAPFAKPVGPLGLPGAPVEHHVSGSSAENLSPAYVKAGGPPTAKVPGPGLPRDQIGPPPTPLAQVTATQVEQTPAGDINSTAAAVDAVGQSLALAAGLQPPPKSSLPTKAPPPKAPPAPKFKAPAPSPTPSASTPSTSTPVTPAPSATTPSAPTPSAPTPSAPTPFAPHSANTVANSTQDTQPSRSLEETAAVKARSEIAPESGFAAMAAAAASAEADRAAPVSPVARRQAEVSSAAEADAPWKKRRRGSRAPGETVGEPAQVDVNVKKAAVVDLTPETNEATVTPSIQEGPPLSKLSTKEILEQKVLLTNVPPALKPTELADFFTGAIFSATGHTLAAQWQSGEASKVVLNVHLSGGTAAEVVFGTPLSASIAVALNGIRFKDKALVIKRPAGFSGPPLNRAKLAEVSIKELVASDGSSAAKASSAIASDETGGPVEVITAVQLSGIPATMKGKSVFDLLQQFGGPLKSLNLAINGETGDHLGSGTAEFVEATSAAEAIRFSPLLGLIDVRPRSKRAPEISSVDDVSRQKRQRRSHWDPPHVDDDLGPFEAALRQVPAAAPLDLGPFEAVLPPSSAAFQDLGPFEAVLPPPSHVPNLFDDLGPFEAVLPPAR